MPRTMSDAVLLDTCSFSWSLQGSERLSTRAIAAIVAADQVFISAISLFEITQKVRIGRWPEMKPYIDQLIPYIAAQGSQIIPLDEGICMKAGGMEWAHRDPFDRMLAATARHMGLSIVSSDSVFDEVVTRIW